MNEAGRRLALFAAGLAAVFGLGLLLGAAVGPDTGSGGGGHAPDHDGMDHPEETTMVPAPPTSPPASPPREPAG